MKAPMTAIKRNNDEIPAALMANIGVKGRDEFPDPLFLNFGAVASFISFGGNRQAKKIVISIYTLWKERRRWHLVNIQGNVRMTFFGPVDFGCLIQVSYREASLRFSSRFVVQV